MATKESMPHKYSILCGGKNDKRYQVKKNNLSDPKENFLDLFPKLKI